MRTIVLATISLLLIASTLSLPNWKTKFDSSDRRWANDTTIYGANISAKNSIIDLDWNGTFVTGLATVLNHHNLTCAEFGACTPKTVNQLRKNNTDADFFKKVGVKSYQIQSNFTHLNMTDMKNKLGNGTHAFIISTIPVYSCGSDRHPVLCNDVAVIYDCDEGGVRVIKSNGMDFFLYGFTQIQRALVLEIPSKNKTFHETLSFLE